MANPKGHAASRGAGLADATSNSVACGRYTGGMRLVIALLCATAFALPVLDAQTRKTTPKKSAAKKAPPAPLSRIQAELKCSSELGIGVSTQRRFCDVLTGTDPKEGV